MHVVSAGICQYDAMKAGRSAAAAVVTAAAAAEEWLLGQQQRTDGHWAAVPQLPENLSGFHANGGGMLLWGCWCSSGWEYFRGAKTSCGTVDDDAIAILQSDGSKYSSVSSSEVALIANLLINLL